MKKKVIKIFFLFTLLNNILLAQVEYFVQVNPMTCNYTIIDSIPGVQWIAMSQSTFDKINRRYIFRGQDASNNWFLYSIDATNGHIVSNPQFPDNFFGNIRFDNSSGILYGMHWNGSTPTNMKFISINPTNLNFVVIDSINLTSFSNDAVIDEINHRFVFSGDDSNSVHCLFCMDTQTGLVISKPIFPTPNVMAYFTFDNSSSDLYGLRWSSTPSKSVFVSINPANSNYTVIDTIHYDLSGGILWGYPTIDEINKRYTFCAMDGNNNRSLYSVDISNGQVLSNPAFPTFIAPHNLIETHYDNSSGNLYALHWGDYSEFNQTTEVKTHSNSYDGVNIYPNPANSIISVELKIQNAELTVTDVLGNNLKQQIVTKEKTEIDVSNLKEGVYFIQAKMSAGVVTKKITVQH